MSFSTQRHMARALRCRVRNCRLSQGFEQRWFSDSSEKEKQALLRALSPNKTKPRTKKKATFDHFFANMDKPSEKASRSSPTTRPRRQLAGSNTSETSNNKNSHVDKKVNISSFFDEVNAIMERTKAANDIDNKDVPKKKSKAGTSTVSSLFDILPPPKQFNPNAYPEDAFDSYSELFEITMRSRVFLGRHKNSRLDDDQEKSVLDWLKTDEPVVTHNLPFLEKAAKEGIASSAEEEQAPELLRSELQTQKNIFMDHHGWSDSQYNGAMGALSNLGNLCAKHASAPALEISWQKMKEAGYTPDKKTLNVYLYVSSTFSVRPIRVKSGSSVLDFLGGTDSDNDEKEAQEDRKEKKDFEAKTDAASEVAICHDLFHEPSEQSTSIRVRMLVSQGKAKEAERLLDTNSKSDDLRLRTYQPVYQCYLDQGDVSAAFKLFVKMKQGDFVLLQPETYIQLMAKIAEEGFFIPGAEPIDGVKDLGYKEGSGPILFDQLASELAHNSIEITSASAKRLYSALQSGFEGHEFSGNLKQMHFLESLKSHNELASPDDLVASRVTLDESTGRCPRTGSRLRLINLDAEKKKQLQDGLVYLAVTSYEERQKEKNSKAQDDLRRFGEWLGERSGERFTAIIDGPNVAFYMQNFQEGTFNYFQIEFVLDTLEKMGENVLVILPYKYTQNSFILSKPSGTVRQRLSSKEKAIRDKLISSGKIYAVPVGCLDDYYWMYASVSSQNSTGKYEELYVPLENAEGRWPGNRPMLVSNDKMRDHKLSLLEPRLFRRWYSNFIVNFTFCAFVGEECVDKEIGFSTADFYSREIQGNEVVDEAGVTRGTIWHFPVSDWDDNESFCVRIPR